MITIQCNTDQPQGISQLNQPKEEGERGKDSTHCKDNQTDNQVSKETG